jgi:hypothetical protein
MKPGPNFKMKKQTKRFLAGKRGIHGINQLKRLMIESQLHEEAAARAKLSKGKDTE